MPFRDDLLEPIDGDAPAGPSLRYDPIYDEIKEARRYDDPNEPRGAFERELKKADYAKVVKLAGDALAKRSKDLQLVAWLTEGTVRREGLSGLLEGLLLIRELLDRFWGDIHPEIDDGDLEYRAAPLGWLGGHSDMILALRTAPLNERGHSLVDYEEARRLGPEADADDAAKKARAAAQEAGKPLIEDWDEAFTATSKAWLKDLHASVHGSLEALDTLETFSDEAFGDAAPSFHPLKDALQEIRRVADQLLAKKLELEPDPPEVEPMEPMAEQPEAAESTGGAASSEAPPGDAARAPVTVSVEPKSRKEAAERVAAAARFMRLEAPSDPASYLLVRGLRWGELRAGGELVDPKLLEAPPTQVRTRLKTLLLDGAWMELLHAGEDVMATAFGRGWLDLQRYVLTACDGLGSEFDVVSSAIRSALRSLLTDLPGLPELTLMDDSPAANRETRLWLTEDLGFAGLSDQARAELSDADNGEPKTMRGAWERAQEKLRAGQPRKAIELLMQSASREASERARFIRRSQAASIMLDSRMDEVAMPILRELLAQIDEHKLEEWEDAEILSRPMGLLYRCMGRVEGDSDARRTLYLRVARLDPVRAMRFDSDDPGSSQDADPSSPEQTAAENGDA